MKLIKKIGIFLIVAIILCSILSICVFATEAESAPVDESTTEANGNGKLDMNLGDPDKEELNLTFDQRVEYALQGTVTGMVMVFAVLSLLALIVSISKIVFYTIPQKKAEKKEKARQEAMAKNAAPAEPVAPATPAPVEAQDDGELAAVITAAIAAMIDSSEYKNEFVGGFRVVSFKRSTQNAWNRK